MKRYKMPQNIAMNEVKAEVAGCNINTQVYLDFYKKTLINYQEKKSKLTVHLQLASKRPRNTLRNKSETCRTQNPAKVWKQKRN